MAGSDDFTGQNIQDTYQRVLQISSSGQIADGTGSVVPLLQVTASHAISASHEITYEISSSHAQKADTLGGLTTTVAELNYLNGLTSGEATMIKRIDSNDISNAEWGHVAAMNQNVATANSVIFASMLSPGTFGHGGVYGTQSWADPKSKRIMVLMIQREGLKNSDGSEMRAAFQRVAADVYGVESVV